ncbi:MAG: PA2779 family protein, partial [Desulfobulbaceae bacterium]|nr:PA2779 family protein [Desulfobulbaceae bacterium]
RQEVRDAFVKKGINPEQAKSRVASLTDQEISQICKTLDQLPAGGDGFGAVIGAAVLIFLVLLLTDILGFTNVFPWVKSM